MKSLINRILSNDKITTLRNSLKLKPVQINKYSSVNASISDAFLFRTDQNFLTYFRFSDILNIFYNIKNSKVELVFFDNKNNFIKKLNLDKIYKLNEICIDKEFMNNREVYGHFYIFHDHKQVGLDNLLLSNRCYLGFSKKGINPSFVHGNSFVKGKNFINGKIESNFVKTSFLKNYKYFIQEDFSDVDKLELFFNNPTNKLIKFTVNGKNYSIEPDNDIMVKMTKTEKVEIISNCTQLRPLVFTFKENFYDVHHC